MFCRDERLVWVSVSLATGAVRLIFAGWLPQDDLFGWRLPLV